jgi:hypothetical protein
MLAHNILELVLEWPSRKESKTIVDSNKFGRTIIIEITCVTKVKETHMWQ